MRRALPFSSMAAIVLTGCAGVAIDENYREVQRFAQTQAGSEVRWLRSDEERASMSAEVDRLLERPLSMDDAVRIALGYSPAFQSLLAEAAVASADATGSARIGNPVFTFERLFRSGAEGREIDIGRSLGISLFDLLFLPARLEQAEFRQQQTRLQSSITLLSTVTEVRQAWVDAIAARQVARYREEVATAAGTAAELARRMQATGNFSRLQRANRFYDTSAPAYLRTHPLTTDRIADMESRSETAPYQQVEDSLDFQLVRARLRAQEDSAQDAVLAARKVLDEKRYNSETAARYGLVTALIRARQFKDAETEAQKLPSGKTGSPMIQLLIARTALAAGNQMLALQRYQAGSQAYPGYRPLQYGYISALLAAGRSSDAQAQVDRQLALYPLDRRLWRLAAQTHAQQGHRLLSHRAQAEAAALSGNLVAAIEQIALGIKAGDGSFHEMSAAEARRREWQEIEKSQRKN